MECPKCQSVLAVVRTQRGAEIESRDLFCPRCSYKATSLTFLILRAEKNPKGSTSRTLVSLAEGGTFDELKEKLRKMLPKP